MLTDLWAYLSCTSTTFLPLFYATDIKLLKQTTNLIYIFRLLFYFNQIYRLIPAP